MNHKALSRVRQIAPAAALMLLFACAAFADAYDDLAKYDWTAGREPLASIEAQIRAAKTPAAKQAIEAKLLKVLSAETRVRIVQLLKSRALCVNALASRLNITQGAVSQHLRYMCNAGLVIGEKRGYFVHYQLNEKVLAAWREDIGRLLDPGDGPCTDTKGASEDAVMRHNRAAATEVPPSSA